LRATPAPPAPQPAARPASAAAAPKLQAPPAVAAKPVQPSPSPVSSSAPAPAPSGNLKDALLTEIKRAKTVFYNTVVAQAQKIEVTGDRVTFTFSPNHRTLRDMFEQNRAWIESAAQQVSGRKIAVASVQTDGAAAAKESAAAPAAGKE